MKISRMPWRYIVKHNLGNSINDSWEEDQDLLAGPRRRRPSIKYLRKPRLRVSRFNFPVVTVETTASGHPSGRLAYPPTRRMRPRLAVHPSSTKSGSQDSNRWGGAVILSAINDNGVLDPPVPQPFFGGSGGGESVFFPKPSWQKDLPGTGRQVPDVSALADPYTGVPIVVTQNGMQGVQVGWGGTSLASPIFTALWAIAEQKAGHSLGLAAPTIAALKPGELVDVLPLSSPTNAAGTIFAKTGSTHYSATALFDGLVENATGFTSAVWTTPAEVWTLPSPSAWIAR